MPPKSTTNKQQQQHPKPNTQDLFPMFDADGFCDLLHSDDDDDDGGRNHHRLGNVNRVVKGGDALLDESMSRMASPIKNEIEKGGNNSNDASNNSGGNQDAAHKKEGDQLQQQQQQVQAAFEGTSDVAPVFRRFWLGRDPTLSRYGQAVEKAIQRCRELEEQIRQQQQQLHAMSIRQPLPQQLDSFVSSSIPSVPASQQQQQQLPRQRGANNRNDSRDQQQQQRVNLQQLHAELADALQVRQRLSRLVNIDRALKAPSAEADVLLPLLVQPGEYEEQQRESGQQLLLTQHDDNNEMDAEQTTTDDRAAAQNNDDVDDNPFADLTDEEQRRAGGESQQDAAARRLQQQQQQQQQREQQRERERQERQRRRAIEESKPKYKAHQAHGLRFLWESLVVPIQQQATSRIASAGAVLAAGMGLGKTLMSLSFVHLFLTHIKADARVLIVVPRSVIITWLSELENWRPHLPALRHVNVFDLAKDEVVQQQQRNDYGPAHQLPLSNAERWIRYGGIGFVGFEKLRFLYENWLKIKEKDEEAAARRKLEARLAYAAAGNNADDNLDDPFATSSDDDDDDGDDDIAENNKNKKNKRKPKIQLPPRTTPLTTAEAIFTTKFEIVIVDEAHRLRSVKTKEAAAVRNVQSKRRLALTGTPLQNRLMDHWAMIEFAIPSFFNKKRFQSFFVAPIDASVRADAPRDVVDLARKRMFTLQKEIERFVLRVPPSVLERQLPQLTEIVLIVPLSKAQARLYDAVRHYMMEASKTLRTAPVLQFQHSTSQLGIHPLLYKKMTFADTIRRELMGEDGAPAPHLVPKTGGAKKVKGKEAVEKQQLALQRQNTVFDNWKKVPTAAAAKSAGKHGTSNNNNNNNGDVICLDEDVVEIDGINNSNNNNKHANHDDDDEDDDDVPFAVRLNGNAAAAAKQQAAAAPAPKQKKQTAAPAPAAKKQQPPAPKLDPKAMTEDQLRDAGEWAELIDRSINQGTLLDSSPRCEMFLRLMHQVMEQGESALVFSHSTQILDFAEALLDRFSVEWRVEGFRKRVRIDGSVQMRQRREAVEAFQLQKAATHLMNKQKKKMPAPKKKKAAAPAAKAKPPAAAGVAPKPKKKVRRTRSSDDDDDDDDDDADDESSGSEEDPNIENTSGESGDSSDGSSSESASSSSSDSSSSSSSSSSSDPDDDAEEEEALFRERFTQISSQTLGQKVCCDGDGDDDDDDDDEKSSNSNNGESQLEDEATIQERERHAPRIFMLSTKAGGVGLTLCRASRVFLLDNGFNPSDERQAIARAYRYGQKRPVFVYRLIGFGSFEQSIFNMKLSKEWLFQTVVDSDNLRRDNLAGLKLTKQLQHELPPVPSWDQVPPGSRVETKRVLLADANVLQVVMQHVVVDATARQHGGDEAAHQLANELMNYKSKSSNNNVNNHNSDTSDDQPRGGGAQKSTTVVSNVDDDNDADDDPFSFSSQPQRPVMQQQQQQQRHLNQQQLKQQRLRERQKEWERLQLAGHPLLRDDVLARQGLLIGALRWTSLLPGDDDALYGDAEMKYYQSFVQGGGLGGGVDGGDLSELGQQQYGRGAVTLPKVAAQVEQSRLAADSLLEVLRTAIEQRKEAAAGRQTPEAQQNLARAERVLQNMLEPKTAPSLEARRIFDPNRERNALRRKHEEENERRMKMAAPETELLHGGQSHNDAICLSDDDDDDDAGAKNKGNKNNNNNAAAAAGGRLPAAPAISKNNGNKPNLPPKQQQQRQHHEVIELDDD